MEKSKYDFIAELLEKKGISSIQKERILKLAVSEIKSDTAFDEDLKNRIQKIEERLLIKNVQTDQNSDPHSVNVDSIKHSDVEKGDVIKEKSVLPDYIDPTGLSKFLFEYNQNSILKYTCHTIDEIDIIHLINKHCSTNEYNLAKHQKIIEKEFKKLSSRHSISKKYL